MPIEAEFPTRLKHRYKPVFEPAIEFFKSQSVNAAGPSFTGRVSLGAGKNIFWIAAALINFDFSKPDVILRLNFKYEF